MDIKIELQKFRASIKDSICHILVECYKENNNGLLPNWENDEEIVIDGSVINNLPIIIECSNTYDENTCLEKQMISECRVTLDYNLFFICGEFDDEIEWTDISTDELVKILFMLEQLNK